jgi:O-antigen ligase/Tfp pilus assembly protein PilF
MRAVPRDIPVLSILCLAAAFGLALFYHGTPDVTYGPMMVMAGFAGILFLAPGLKNGWSMPRSFTAAAIGAWWLFLAASLLWSQTPYISFYFFLIFSILPFLFFAFVIAPEPERACRSASLCLFAVISGIALWAIIQFLFLFDEYGARIRHPFFDPNSMAALLNMGLIPALAFLMTAQERRAVIAGGVLYALFAAALAATQSRGGMIAAATAVIVLFPFFNARPLRDHARRWSAAIVIGITAPFAVWIYDMQIHGRHTMKAVFGGDGGSMMDRGALWGSTWNMIRDHFWTGTGLASFSYHYPAYRLPVDRSDGYFAHMDPLQLAAEMGILAPILFYIVLTAILIRTIRAVRGVEGVLRLHIVMPFCAMLAVVLHTHLNYHLYMPAILIPLAVALSYWYLMTERAMGETRSIIPMSSLTRRLAIAVIALPLLLAAAWSVRASMSTYHLSRAETFLNVNDIKAGQEEVEKAAFWGPASKPQIAQYESRWRRQALQMNGTAMTADERRKLYNEAQAALDEMERLQPSLSLVHTARAKLYYAAQGHGLITDGYERALESLEEALKANPLDIDARNSMAQIYMRNGEFRRALAVMAEGLKWPRPKGQADINYLAVTAELYRQAGNEKAFQNLIEEARRRAAAYGLLSNRTDQ